MIVDVIALLVLVICIFYQIKGRIAGSESNEDTGCFVVVMIIVFGPFFSYCSIPRYKEWRNEIQVRDARDQMMETSFRSSPALKTTFNKLQAEIDKWKESEEKFTRLEEAAQTAGGRSLAKEKLAGIGQVLSKLTESREKTLEQIEMIAMESEGQFTELDRKALDDLSLKVEDSVRDARELREGLADQ